MSPKRMFIVMLSATVLLVGLALIGTYFGSKLIVAEGDKLMELKLDQQVLDHQNTALQQAKKDIAEYEELEKIARSVVPQDKDQARTVLELVELASRSGISVTSVRFPESLLGQISRGAKKTATTDSNLTQLTPLADLKGVYSMEISIQTDPEQSVTYNQLISFLQRLENNRRTAQVTNISITPNGTNRNNVTFTLSLTSYVKPVGNK